MISSATTYRDTIGTILFTSALYSSYRTIHSGQGNSHIVADLVYPSEALLRFSAVIRPDHTQAFPILSRMHRITALQPCSHEPYPLASLQTAGAATAVDGKVTPFTIPPTPMCFLNELVDGLEQDDIFEQG